MPPFARRAWFVVACWAFVVWTPSCKSPDNAQPTPEKARRASSEQPSARPTAGPAEPVLLPFWPGSAERGKQLVREFECNRCHEGTGLSAPTLDKDCVRCHEQIATDKFQAAPAKLAKWKPHVLPYRDVPSLTALGARLRPAWLMDYLLNPRDLRPNLAQTMPRLKLTTEQARDITTHLTSAAPAIAPGPLVSGDAQQIAHGKQLMLERGCVGCHHMTGAGFAAPPKSEPAPRTLGLALDLRFARKRAEPAMLLLWLIDPTKVKHDAAMPNLALAAIDARDLAAFLSFGELSPEPASAPFTRLSVLARRVAFDEVNERVFAVTCRHCHTNPDLADGDGGPGNTGGFGFTARKIDFSSYQGIQSGGIDAEGRRVSLFAPTSDGLPRLVASLVARAGERAGHVSEEVRGMPLGLPPLSPEQIQLVESWVEQGRPL